MTQHTTAQFQSRAHEIRQQRVIEHEADHGRTCHCELWQWQQDNPVA